jgi:hypothetical protein
MHAIRAAAVAILADLRRAREPGPARDWAAAHALCLALLADDAGSPRWWWRVAVAVGQLRAVMGR